MKQLIIVLTLALGVSGCVRAPQPKVPTAPTLGFGGAEAGFGGTAQPANKLGARMMLSPSYPACTPGNGVQCTTPYGLYLPPHGYPNWDGPLNYNAQAINDAIVAVAGGGSKPSIPVGGTQYYSTVTAFSGGSPINELAFAGSTLSDRVTASCAAFAGVGGTVIIPSTETSVDPAFVPLPIGCLVEDQRGIVYPTREYYAVQSAPTSGNLLRAYWDTSLGPTQNQNFVGDQLGCVWQAGGYNAYNGSTGIKSNEYCYGLGLISRTPGQHGGASYNQSNFSPGDVYREGGEITDTGWQNTFGDEGLEYHTPNLIAGAPALTSPISAINSSTLSLNCTPSGDSCEQLGEQQPIVNTSRGVQNTGTATISGGNPPIVTISGGSVTCPGGTNPCSSNTQGGVGLFFEFTGETNAGIHIVMPIIAVSSDGTQLTLLIQNRNTTGGPTNSNWNGYTTTGPYAVYRGSAISAVPFVGQGVEPKLATVLDTTPFQVGDSIMVPGGNNRNVNGYNLQMTLNVPCTSNGACVGFGVTSQGHYPVTYGFSTSGGFKLAPFRATWVGGTAPIWGMTMDGPPPGNGYYQGGDNATLNTNENMLCAITTSAGSNTCLTYFRDGVLNGWGFNISGLRLVGMDTGQDITLPGSFTSTAGSLSNPFNGAIGPHGNLLKYSNFGDVGTTWVQGCSGSGNVTITTGVTDPFGGTNAIAMAMPNPTGCAGAYSGLYQSVSPLPTPGTVLTMSVYIQGAVGGETPEYGAVTNLYPIPVLTCADYTLATTSWVRHSCTFTMPAGASYLRLNFSGGTASQTINYSNAQLDAASAPGYPVNTLASAQPETTGIIGTSIQDTGLTPGATVPICTSGTNGSFGACTAYTGTCASGTTLTVVNGLITGCS